MPEDGPPRDQDADDAERYAREHGGRDSPIEEGKLC